MTIPARHLSHRMINEGSFVPTDKERVLKALFILGPSRQITGEMQIRNARWIFSYSLILLTYYIGLGAMCVQFGYCTKFGGHLDNYKSVYYC